jgi:hypothetical protein
MFVARLRDEKKKKARKKEEKITPVYLVRIGACPGFDLGSCEHSRMRVGTVLV